MKSGFGPDVWGDLSVFVEILCLGKSADLVQADLTVGVDESRVDLFAGDVHFNRARGQVQLGANGCDDSVFKENGSSLDHTVPDGVNGPADQTDRFALDGGWHLSGKR